MSPLSIQTPVFISYCSPVQGRMARASIAVYEFGNVFISQHIYKSVWLTKNVNVFIMWEDPTEGKTTNVTNTL